MKKEMVPNSRRLALILPMHKKENTVIATTTENSEKIMELEYKSKKYASIKNGGGHIITIN